MGALTMASKLGVSLHIEDIEVILNDYYIACDRHDFYESADDNVDDLRIGKLRSWSNDNGFDTESFLEDLDLDAPECTVVSFDDDFPLSDAVPWPTDDDHLDLYILNVIRFIVKNRYSPLHLPRFHSICGLRAGLWNRYWTQNENKSIVLEAVDQLPNAKGLREEMESFDGRDRLWSVMSIGYRQNDYRFMQFVVDAYYRDNIISDRSRQILPGAQPMWHWMKLFPDDTVSAVMKNYKVDDTLRIGLDLRSSGLCNVRVLVADLDTKL